jgi:hypothetical protein
MPTGGGRPKAAAGATYQGRDEINKVFVFHVELVVRKLSTLFLLFESSDDREPAAESEKPVELPSDSP